MVVVILTTSSFSGGKKKWGGGAKWVEEVHNFVEEIKSKRVYYERH